MAAAGFRAAGVGVAGVCGRVDPAAVVVAVSALPITPSAAALAEMRRMTSRAARTPQHDATTCSRGFGAAAGVGDHREPEFRRSIVAVTSVSMRCVAATVADADDDEGDGVSPGGA